MTSETSYENGTLTVVRLFDAPREAVFDAWIKTSKVRLWWGCAVGTDVESDVEPKLGGTYSHQMILHNKSAYKQVGIITEYDPPRLLAFDLTDSMRDEITPVRVEFTIEDEQTRVQLTQSNLLDAYSQFVVAGWSAAFEKLAEILVETAVS